MRLLRLFFVCMLFSSAAAYADSKNMADYTLRIHIFNRNETSFYHWRQVDEAKGEGRANLFANGEVHGVDFTFDCPEKLKASFGYETYPARWKKPNEELVVLLPVFGKANTYFTCHLKTDVKTFAYRSHEGKLGSESPAEFKAWMIRHDYDPEHGKDQPVRLAKEEQPPAAPEPAPAP